MTKAVYNPPLLPSVLPEQLVQRFDMLPLKQIPKVHVTTRAEVYAVLVLDGLDVGVVTFYSKSAIIVPGPIALHTKVRL